MANTKTSKSASTKKATIKKTKDVEEKVNVVDSVVEETIEEVQADSAEELKPQGSEDDVNNNTSKTEETEAEVKQSDETTEVSDGIDLPEEDDVPDSGALHSEQIHVSAEEVKDFTFDKFSDSDARQDEIIVPAPSVVVREKEVHVAKPLFPPSKYTQKTIVKKYH